ncbi:MAG: putative TBP-interacting DNA helicase, partial [Streblomastix strix]
ILSTDPYTKDDLLQIIQVRCEEEGVEIDEEAIDALTAIAEETSLRYALQLITTSNVVSQKRKSAKVEIQDVSKVLKLFADVHTSEQTLIDFDKDFVLDSNDYGIDQQEDDEQGIDKERRQQGIRDKEDEIEQENSKKDGKKMDVD